MADPAATLRIASTGAPIVDGVLLVLQSDSCPVAAYVVAQLAVEVNRAPLFVTCAFFIISYL
jgi:hypothetical protein